MATVTSFPLTTALLPSASTAAQGIVALATDASTVTGSNTTTATTPANVTAKLAAPGPIGSTTPGTGAFSTLSATGLITATAGQIAFPATQNPSSNVNTLDDYEEGTWVPTFGGFSAAPTGGSASYVKIGRLVFVSVNGWVSGTSNATTKTITLPFAAQAADVMAGVGHAMDNGSFSNTPCRFDTRGASAVCDVYKDLNATLWTASGGSTFDFSLSYRASA